jgi:hypothetical protein
MSEDNSWADQWFKAQQQFVDAWSDMAKTGSSGNASQSDLWAHSFDLWRKACEGKTQPDMELAMRKCMDMGKEYFAMAEQVSKGLSEGANPVEAINQWLEQMKQSLQQFGGMPGFNGAGWRDARVQRRRGQRLHETMVCSKCQLAGNGGRTDADEPGDVANARHEYFGFQPG